MAWRKDIVMTYFITYPRCFVKRAPLEATANSLSKGDAELMVLYDQYINAKIDTSTWEFRKRVLSIAMRLFDGFGQFVDDQSRDPNVNGYNLDFLKDTLNYIETGERKLGCEQWIELVNEVEEISTVHTGQRLNVTAYKGLRSTSDTIQKWLSWPRGFEDLMLSLYVFFGGQRVPYFNSTTERTPVGIAD